MNESGSELRSALHLRSWKQKQ